MKKILETAQLAARLAAAEILSHWDNLKIDYKAINDLVTQADVASERLIQQTILDAFPTHQFYAEESADRAALESEQLWIIDPLDGTTNFAGGIPHFSISIAYAERGEVKVGVVYDVAKGEMFHAVAGEGALLNDSRIGISFASEIHQCIVSTGFAYERGPLMRATLKSIERLFNNNLRGIRRFGSAALDLCWVACGRFEGFFEYSLNPWDFAAGALILTEAGGKICTHNGELYNLNANGIIVATPGIFEQLKDLTRFSG
ncbi:MAG: inositol monophosphatase [Deltaproteobacteria bacterium]|nr:inositol monophosphatase [Deltaproteobacteria bacterium]